MTRPIVGLIHELALQLALIHELALQLLTMAIIQLFDQVVALT
ncbi:hypothetical protein [Microcystis aeruginosa]